MCTFNERDVLDKNNIIYNEQFMLSNGMTNSILGWGRVCVINDGGDQSLDVPMCMYLCIKILPLHPYTVKES